MTRRDESDRSGKEHVVHGAHYTNRAIHYLDSAGVGGGGGAMPLLPHSIAQVDGQISLLAQTVLYCACIAGVSTWKINSGKFAQSSLLLLPLLSTVVALVVVK